MTLRNRTCQIAIFRKREGTSVISEIAKVSMRVSGIDFPEIAKVKQLFSDIAKGKSMIF